ncbi:MAG: sulfurtransferase TusA family protein [Gammaproteobacteria bacterium]|nr:sulfurtransferase TusA family protein [Gammaproteobacteria bacterium]
MNPPVDVRHTLDARRLLCPMPVIRLQDFVSRLPGGDVVDVYCTDPGTRSDIPAWCRINGHELLAIEERQDEIIISVRVGEREHSRG